MSGSVLDGEDLVQETLAQAFYYLPSLKDESRLESWLFRIAHKQSRVKASVPARYMSPC